MKDLKILVIEDDEDLAQSLKLFLDDLGNVTLSNDGFDGQMLGEDGIYDLVVLDLMLPEISGFEILKKWRTTDKLDMPVLILTAKDTLSDKVHGFQLGADDYLTKPFHREELLLRVKALLRRSGRIGDENQLVVGNFTANLKNRTVTLSDTELDLNGKEYDLLIYFLQNPETIITKEQIFDRLWGFDSDTALSVIEVYMSNLRKKIKQASDIQPIKTIRNVGYILETEA
ncbi:response regulator transcription factor [Lentilactobacillus sp. SPB1-3]|uniref:Response regulator transcription factor n=1 Tax=Lentilactobacillus terminaliae TaxID=3003483 RepID=A0ACD5DE26_9LACO|nr:response regulator transcription factor [Lentilactobacillus sp. SPB1-3]MCZ0977552.1 response regulator transcription factor [Lentilactobacillus sp. SPB1-3]